MKILLVLYPIQAYADVFTGKDIPDEIKGKYVRAYQYLVRKRYPDFQVVWMMFSGPDSSETPDMSQLWKGITIEKKDIIGACGVSFSEHCNKKLYPDPEVVLGTCSQPIEQLIVGGFHFWDCVEKTAEHAYQKGINVLVDEDLTEFFFFRVQNQKGIPSKASIPLSREKSAEKVRQRSNSRTLERIRELEKNRPWVPRT